MKYFITFICAALFLTSCNHSDEPEPEPEPINIANRTVLVYIAGENSLSDFIKDELSEMLEGSRNINEKTDNLILYVDAADSTTPPYLIRYKNGESADSTSMEESYSSDPYIINKVLQATFDKYPAKEYGLVLWGHASGWAIEKDSVVYNSAITSRTRDNRPQKAFGIDNGKNTTASGGTWINMYTLAKVLEGTGKKLQFIFADCCQFLSIESAYELRNTCDYIIGSAAEIPGEGAPYETMVPAIFNKSNTFYKNMVDAYYEQVSWGYREPLAVIKTSELDNLATCTKSVLQSFVPDAVSQEAPYLDLDGLIYYQGSSYGYYHYYYDMNDIMLRYASTGDYQQWKDAFDRAIIYKTPTEGLSGQWMTNSTNNIDFRSFTLDDTHYGGVSMFIPQYPTANYTSYNTNIRKTSWYYAAGLNDLGW